MKISTKGRYALRMMVDLAEHDNGEYIRLKEIAKRQEITLKYLEQIIPQLTRSGLVRSYRGNNGGYQLARRPEDYTAGEIIRALEGSLAPIACIEDDPNRCPRKDNCATLDFWQGLWDVVNQYLDSVTLADLVAGHMADDSSANDSLAHNSATNDSLANDSMTDDRQEGQDAGTV